MFDNDKDIVQGGEVVSADLKTEALLASEPAHETDAATKQETATLDSHSVESQDSGIGFQTPPGSLEVPPPPPGLTDMHQLEEDFPDLPDNMSLDELHAKVKKLFPGFKPNSILRFSSLLGPGKPSSLPKLWSEAKKP